MIEAGVVPLLMDLLTNSEVDWKSRQEAAWTIGNAAANGGRKQVRYRLSSRRIRVAFPAEENHTKEKPTKPIIEKYEFPFFQ